MNRSFLPAMWMLLAATALVHGLPDTAAGAQGTAGKTAPPPVYVPPPDLGSPQARQGAATRGIGDRALALDVLAPDHVGLTTRGQPNLYWYVSAPSRVTVKITVLDEKSPDPVLETDMNRTESAGIYRISLDDYKVTLQPGVEYEWFVALVTDPNRRARDVVSGGVIKRVPDAAAPTPGAEDDALRRVYFYAENGFWYDAIDELSILLDTSTGARKLHTYRAGLLEQVGLRDAADFARALASGRE